MYEARTIALFVVHSARRRRGPLRFLVVIPAIVGLLLVASPLVLAQNGGPSALCHVTDGRFTDCPGGGREWSDVPVRSFPATQSFLYASQADLDPTKGSPLDTFVLMYDECGRTTPLGPDEYFLVSFKTVEVENGVEKLEHYVLHVFSDGTIVFVEDGLVEPSGRATVVDGMRGKVGFGPSPNCAFDHVIAEFQVPLSITGSSYSPDPLFWGASAPPPPPPRECLPGQIQVPVLVNVLTGVTAGAAATSASIEQMVRDASDILTQGGMCMTVTLVDRDTSDLGNNDGLLDQQEISTLIDDCVEELSARFGRDAGYKITLVNGFTFSATTAGVAVGAPPSGDGVPIPPIGSPPTLGLRGYPCVFVKADHPNPGFNLAHEIGHTAGLPHRDDENNLMEGRSGGGSHLDPAQQLAVQIAAIRRRANSEHRAWTDPIGDASPGYIDLRLGSLFAQSLAADLEIQASLAGFFPAGAVNVRLEVLFDTDNNPSTGVTVGAQTGVDKRLRVTLTGRFPFTAPSGTFNAMLIDVASGVATPLEPGLVDRLSLVFDFVDAAQPFADVVRQAVPFPMLGVSSSRMPVTITTTDLGSGASDRVSFVFELSTTPGVPAIRAGFNASTLAANDDASSGRVPFGFTATFFGETFDSGFVNNNGNLTLDLPLFAFTPFGLTATDRAIIAPFFADVDTRVGNVVTFGPGTVNGRRAFGATWPGVGCFDRNVSALNFFQVVLIDRSDVAAGDFDIEFNYDSILWEAGRASGGNAACLGGTSARVGFSNGSGLPGTSFELPGSGVDGALLDTNATSGLIHRSLNSSQPGRYVFAVRRGTPVVDGDDRDNDGIADDLDNCPSVANADQRDDNFNGIGDACETPGLRHSTAAFMQANFDGTTTVEPHSLLVSQEPSLLEQIARIVQFRVAAGLTQSAQTTATNLVQSQVALGLVAPGGAAALVAAVLNRITPGLRGDIDRDGDVDGDDLNLLLAERGRPVGQSQCGAACDLDGDGTITALDARVLVTLCTRARCVTQ